MGERKAEILVGVAVSAALLILVLSIIWGKGMNVFSGRVRLVVRFEDVGGLGKGDPVLIRGIQCGEIEHIVLEHDFVEVRMWIREDVTLYSDCRIVVESRELIGGKQVVIHPGTSLQFADMNGVFRGETKGDVGDLFVNVEAVVARADSVLRQVEDFVRKNRLNKALESVEALTSQAQALVSENRKGLQLSVERLDQMTRDLQEDSTVFHFGNVVTRLDSTVRLMKNIALRMDSEDGTFGKLLRDRWLYDQLLETTANLDSLIADIKNNPKKYIRFSVF
ncbi:MAG: MlaD family protein [bacterium]